MQTFLPYPSFAETAKVLDFRRLGKQRVETLQILKSLTFGGGWSNHPCVAMWKGGERYLIEYGVAICEEWIKRGYKDTCLNKIKEYARYFNNSARPEWLGNEAFHLAHRSNLLRKDPGYYRRFWDCPDNLDYVWPQKSK